MKRHYGKKKLNNRGSALVMVLTIISFIAILGALSMSTALLNVRMRGMNRSSDKNFYELETALDEIYAQTGRISSEILKEQYALIVEKLYTEYEDNDAANAALKTGFMNEFKEKILGGAGTVGDLEAEGNYGEIAEWLKSMSSTFSDAQKAPDFGVSVKSVILNEKAEDIKSAGASIYSGVTFKDLCLTYTNPETETESALTVDFTVDVPWIRFMNNGGAMLDYIMAANDGISVNEGGTSRQQNEFNGNIYGGFITVDNASVTARTNMMAAGNSLTVKQKGTLKTEPDSASESGTGDAGDNEPENGTGDAGDNESESGTGSVWAANIELDAQSSLESKHMNFYVQDDLTLTNNGNSVKLSGGYYGYGNEGNYEGNPQMPGMSSAIIINDKSSRVDLSGLDSLMLAGRAYMDFTGKESRYVYPMGESLAVKATQTLYLIPASGITVDGKPAGSNPVLLPERDEAYQIGISIKEKERGKDDAGKDQVYSVKVSDGAEKPEVSLESTDDTEPAAAFVYMRGKLYVFYDFPSNTKRSEFFEYYLSRNAANFDSLLNKANMTGLSSKQETGGVSFNEDGQITTSGSLYQVAGAGEGKTQNFELLETRRSEDVTVGDVTNTLKWVELGLKLSKSFENIRFNLFESLKVKGERGKDAAPVGNYVRLDKLGKKDIYYQTGDGCAVFLSGSDVRIDTSAGTVSSGTGAAGNRTENMAAGLVVSAGNVEITGDGEFKGLIMAKGSISIKGDAALTADPDTYYPLLEEKETAEYFYDYSDPASAVIDHYEDFVKRENWRRSGLEPGGGDK